MNGSNEALEGGLFVFKMNKANKILLSQNCQ